MQHIVVATDLTPASDAAVERAYLASQAMGANLRLVHVLPELLPPLLADRRIRSVERELRHRIRGEGHGTRASCNVMRGDTSRGIVRESENMDAVLTVFGHHMNGTQRRWLTATVPERSLRLIRNAALVVRDEPPGPAEYRRVLLAPDDGVEIATLMPYVRRLASDAALHQIDLRDPSGKRRPKQRVVDHVRAMGRALDADLLVIGVPRDETPNPFRFRRLLTPLIRAPQCDTLVVPQDCTATPPAETSGEARVRIAS